MTAPVSAAVDVYFDLVRRQLERFRSSQGEVLGRAAACVSERLRRGGVLHLFGTGHSHMLAEEVFYRAGGLIPVNAMLDESVVLSGGATRSTATERTPGAAAAIAARYDLRDTDAGVVISHSGLNPAPVEMAQLMKGRGLAVVAITCVAHTEASRARRPPGALLLEVADVVLDTGGVYGDASLSLPNVAYPVGPTSTAVGAAIAQALVIAVLERLAAGGDRVLNLPSANAAGADLGPVGEALGRYRGRIRHL